MISMTLSQFSHVLFPHFLRYRSEITHTNTCAKSVKTFTLQSTRLAMKFNEESSLHILPNICMYVCM